MPPSLPRLAFTIGDPAGIGPELILKAFRSETLQSICEPIVVGEIPLLEDHARILGMPATFTPIHYDRDAGFAPPYVEAEQEGAIPVLEPPSGRFEGELVLGQVDERCGAVAHRAIVEAVRLCLRGEVEGIVTAPLHKESLNASGVLFPGHTEMLAHLAHARETAMLLVGRGLRVVLATIHCPLREVPARITRERLDPLLDLTGAFIGRFGIERPRIAVAGLNPHAGEGGLFGSEERLVIAPAVEAARDRGLDVAGPLPGDTVFHSMLEGQFDVVVAMYHDQGLAALKTLDFHGGVNITMGLPFVRTSPDHGTAFNLAGRGVADPRSFMKAVEIAAQLAAR